MTQNVQRKEVDQVIKDFNALRKVKSTVVAKAMSSFDKSLSNLINEVKSKQLPPNTEEMKSYQGDIDKLYQDSLHKDGNGQILVGEDGKPKIKNQQKFQKDLEELSKQHPIATKQIAEHEAEFQAFLLEDFALEIDSVAEDKLGDSVSYEDLVLIRKYFTKKLEA